MVVKRRKKVRKLRGSRTHGWGSPKKHRGAGSRGGKGRAGLSRKKGQQKTGTVFNIKLKERMKDKGFVLYKSKKDKTINLKDIEKNLEKYLKENIAEKKKGKIEIDVSKLGYTKVLGAGKLTQGVIIKAKGFSKKAEEKIKAVKGEIVKG